MKISSPDSKHKPQEKQDMTLSAKIYLIPNTCTFLWLTFTSVALQHVPANDKSSLSRMLTQMST